MSDSVNTVWGYLVNFEIKIKILWHFEMFVNTGPYVAGKRYSSYSFHQISGKFMKTLTTMPQYKVFTFLGNRPCFTILWHMGVNRKIVKSQYLENS